MRLELRPITLRDARRFVAEHHRHNAPPRGWLFGVGVHVDDQLVGVGIAGRPLAHPMQDGRTVEILRVCTVEPGNVASRTYGALCRAAAALGYRRAITYTLATEPGTSLRASGFTIAERLDPRTTWTSAGRPRYDATLWGQRTLPDQPRIRWERRLD